MKAILLSIKPEYANKILNGTKKYEYRKHLAQESIEKILIYSTCPEKKVIGEVDVIETLTMKKTQLWDHTKVTAGISRSKYREYFDGCMIAHAYHLGIATRYPQPKDLKEFGLVHAPQSFVYIET